MLAIAITFAFLLIVAADDYDEEYEDEGLDESYETSKEPARSLVTEEPTRIYVMEEHEEALRHFPASASVGARLPERNGGGKFAWAEPITLVHIDSHSDLMEIDTAAPEGMSWVKLLSKVAATFGNSSMAQRHRSRWHQRAINKVKISDFVTAAIWLGLVDRVIWIRSDLPSEGYYNGPLPGNYVAELKLERDDGAERDNYEGSWICTSVLRRLKHFKNLELLTGSGSFVSCSPGFDYEAYPSLNFSYTVATMDQVLELLADNKVTPNKLLRGPTSSHGVRDWVLDVDLDSFSTYEPSWALFVENHFDDTFASRVAKLLNTDKQTGSGCLSGHGDKWPLGELHIDIIRKLGELPASIVTAPSSLSEQAKSELVHATMPKNCSIGQDDAVKLYDILHEFDPERRAAWRNVFQTAIGGEFFDEDFARIMLQGAGVLHHASYEQAQRHLRLFEKIIKKFAGEARPRVVTVSRSSGSRYAPTHLLPEIEERVLAALKGFLQEHGGSTVLYPSQEAAEADGIEQRKEATTDEYSEAHSVKWTGVSSSDAQVGGRETEEL